MKLLITLVPFHQSNKVIKVFNQIGLDFHFVINAFGTAPSDIMEILNLDDNRRDCVLSLIPADQCEETLNLLNDKLNLFKAGKGVSFAISLESISKNTLQFVQSLGGTIDERK